MYMNVVLFKTSTYSKVQADNCITLRHLSLTVVCHMRSVANSQLERLTQQLKNEIQQKLKMTCSVGVSSNKLISKIASDYKKPDGLTIIKPKEIMAFLKPLGIRVIPGIGGKTELLFRDSGCEKIEDVLRFDVFELNKKFGRKNGTYIYNAVREFMMVKLGLKLQLFNLVK